VGIFAIYIAYIVVVKGRLRGMNITRELYSAVGAFTAFIIMMSIITPLLSHLPSLVTPPSGGWVLEQYDIVTAVLSAVKFVTALILTPEEFTTYYSLSGVINGIIGFIGGLAYLTAMVIALYKALLALFPFAPLFISLALARPNKPGSIVLMGIGLMTLVATPLIGWVASLFYNITMGVITILTPPCLDIKILGVAYYGPSPALVTTSQGVFMTNGTRYIPIWGCEGVYVTQVAWDWLVLNYTYTRLPPVFSIIPLYNGTLEILAQLPFPATAIENSTGVYGAWFPLRVLRYWANGTGYPINDTAYYIRNESVLFWAWVGGVGGNCSLRINETGMVKTTLVSGPMVLPMFAPLTGTYPPSAPIGYRQMLINATAFNESCIVVFEPGSRWSGYTVLPATGPVEWALAGPLNLITGLNSQWNNVETAFMTVGVITAAVTLLGILLLPYLAIGTAYLGAIIVEFISPLWGVISQLLPF